MPKLAKPELTWKTKDGRNIQFKDMDDDHLQKTLVIVQRREYRDWAKIQIQIDLRDAIEEEAERRELKLLDIDQIENSEYGQYFSSRKKRKDEITNNIP